MDQSNLSVSNGRADVLKDLLTSDGIPICDGCVQLQDLEVGLKVPSQAGGAGFDILDILNILIAMAARYVIKPMLSLKPKDRNVIGID